MVGGFSDRWLMVPLVDGWLFFRSVVGGRWFLVGGLWLVGGRWFCTMPFIKISNLGTNIE